ncbi:Ankyrin repeat [Nesidiocoris tenuis]|uniref:Ankyrin repeat n=1 Tax=Nesidiocoris tenuis TaxID=355587 RepID=A0ABN7B1N1_9HEMI|nr:Ankyrin repeat [Nesidiocoris tenuis]
MAEPTSFTQDAIRDFMIFRGGKVTNHELVKHFKKFLTNPGTQEEARVLFKEYVNNLATITRDPDGGKQLVLKRRYRTPSVDQSLNISGLPTTPLSPTSEGPPLNLRYQPVYQSSFELDIGSPHRSPYRRLSSESLSPSYSLRSPVTPPISPYPQSPVYPQVSLGYQQIVTPLGFPGPSAHHPPPFVEPPIGIPTSPVHAVGRSSPGSRMMPVVPKALGGQSPSLPSIPSAMENPPRLSKSPHGVPQSASFSNIAAHIAQQPFRSTPSSPMVQPSNFRPDFPRRLSTNDSVFVDSTTSPKEHDPPPVPPRRRSSDKSLTKMDLKELEDCKLKEAFGSQPSSLNSADSPMEQKPDDNKENVIENSKISVKERMQKFDRMASESALLNKNTLPSSTSSSSLSVNLHKKRLEKLERDEEDSGSVTLIDGKTREWLVKCAQGDYQAIVKLAAENPKLVKFKQRPGGLNVLIRSGRQASAAQLRQRAAAHPNGDYTFMGLGPLGQDRKDFETLSGLADKMM